MMKRAAVLLILAVVIVLKLYDGRSISYDELIDKASPYQILTVQPYEKLVNNSISVNKN